MQRFIMKSLLALLLLSAALTGFEILAGKIYSDSNTDFKDMIKRIEENVPYYSTIILGSSHSKRGIDGTVLDNKMGNLAFYSQDLYYNVELLKYFLPRAGNLKQVLVEIDHFTMCYDQTDISRFTARRYRKLGIQPRNRFNTMLFLQANFEFINHRESFFFDALRFLFKGERPKPPEVKEARFKSGEKAVRDTLLDRVRLHNGFFRGGKIFKRNLKVLEELDRLSKKYGFDVLVLHSPVTDLYIRALSDELKEVFLKTQRTIRDKYPQWRVLDLQDKYSSEYEKFRDADHLTDEAGFEYAELLNRLLGDPK